MRDRTLGPFVLLVLGLIAPVVSAQPGGVLFIDSIPRGATVSLNGVTRSGVTPLVARGLGPGEHVLEVTRPGYETAIVRVPAVEEVDEVVVSLEPAGVSVIFPRDETVVVGGNPVTARQGILQLSEPRFHLAREGGTLYIDPTPRVERFADALTLAVPIVIGFGTMLTIDALARAPSDVPTLPPSVVAIHATTGVLLGVDIALHLIKRRSVNRFSVAVEAAGDPEQERRIVRDADETLAAGDLFAAVDGYERILDEFPESDLVPAALYRAAGVRILLGDEAEAERLFARVATDYPVAEFYDTSLKNLADLAFRSGDYESGLRHLARIVYYRSPYSRAEIVEYARETAANWIGSDPRSVFRVGSLLESIVGRRSDGYR